MKIKFKIILRILLTLLVLLMLFILSVFIYHKIASNKEANRFKPPGQMVEVNGHKMHVYIEGESDVTLVLMSGGGTSSPYYDFKPLWSQLSKDYRIAVVEKAGYGYSEVADVSRDIDTMLDETRQALLQAGVNLDEGVILVPHSMSGLEAIRWSQKYPDEVMAIIGLDPAVPAVYDDLKVSKLNIQLVTIMSRLGLIRLLPSVFESSDAVKTGVLTDEDIEAYRSLFNRKTLTSNMLDEIDFVMENTKVITDNGYPVNTPMYFFISDGKEVGVNNWGEILNEYLTHINYGKSSELDCGHYVHNIETDVIVDEIEQFITELMID